MNIYSLGGMLLGTAPVSWGLLDHGVGAELFSFVYTPRAPIYEAVQGEALHTYGPSIGRIFLQDEEDRGRFFTGTVRLLPSIQSISLDEEAVQPSTFVADLRSYVGPRALISMEEEESLRASFSVSIVGRAPTIRAISSDFVIATASTSRAAATGRRPRITGIKRS